MSYEELGEEDALHVDFPDDPKTNLATAEGLRLAAEHAGDQRGKMVSMIRAASALCMLGRAEEAMAQARQALDIAEESLLDIGRGAALAVIARICASYASGEDDVEFGYDSAHDAVRLFYKRKHKVGEALAQWSMACLELAFGKPQQAAGCASDSLELLRDQNQGALEVAVCQTLAECYQAVGDFGRASGSLDRVRDIVRAMGDRRREAWCMQVSAQLKMSAQDFYSASACLQTARETFREVGDHNGETKVMENQKEMYLTQGKLSEALSVSKEIVSVFHDAGDKKGEGLALLRVAEMQLDKGDIAKAQKTAGVSITILTVANEWEDVKKAHEFLGAIRHESVRREVQGVMDDNAAFMHVPKHYIIDPALNQRVQGLYGEAVMK